MHIKVKKLDKAIKIFKSNPKNTKSGLTKKGADQQCKCHCHGGTASLKYQLQPYHFKTHYCEACKRGENCTHCIPTQPSPLLDCGCIRNKCSCDPMRVYPPKCCKKCPVNKLPSPIGGKEELTHINPNCFNAKYCKPHKETGEVYYSSKSLSTLISLEFSSYKARVRGMVEKKRIKFPNEPYVTTYGTHANIYNEDYYNKALDDILSELEKI